VAAVVEADLLDPLVMIGFGVMAVGISPVGAFLVQVRIMSFHMGTQDQEISGQI